ncbi:MAG TPA: phosphatase PAP2 family protein [Chloroflexi bacterium]|nr:phosphatase PAP2 family protein [Chloroflexota bacterium]
MLESLVRAGLGLVLALQNLGEGLRPVMQFFTFLGTEEFIMLAMPAVYWCVDAALGLRLGLLIMFSASVNSTAKVLLHLPRPYWVSMQVHPWSTETSFGAPSGHAQNAVVIWSTLASHWRTRLAWAGAIFLIFFISISRLYLGVHFPFDTLLGWVLGLLVLGAGWLLTPLPAAWKRLSSGKRAALLLALVLLLVVIGSGSVMYTAATWRPPQAWRATLVQNAGQAEWDPLSVKPFFSTGGAFLGLAWGWLWLTRRGGYQARGTAVECLKRYLVGLAGTVLLWYGLKVVFPDALTLSAMSLRFVRYALVGWWVAGGAPALFVQWGWARME